MNNFWEMELFEIGSFEFIAYIFYHFFILMGYFLMVMVFGSEANGIDHKIKLRLTKIAQECNDMKNLANNQKIYVQGSEIKILNEESNEPQN